MMSEAQKKAATKWETEKTTQIKFKFHNDHDADILKRLNEVGNKQGYVKYLIRQDIMKAKGGK